MNQLHTGNADKATRFNPGAIRSGLVTNPSWGRFVEVLIAGLLCPSVFGAGLPMTGTGIPSLSAIDNLVSNFMATYKVPGGAVGFVRDGKLLFVRGYGYADTNTQEVVQPDSLFRLASHSKAVTATAILKPVEQGQLTLNQPAFAILNYPAPTYPGASTDPRLAFITIRQLLNHSGGWNRNTAINPDGGTGFDPTVNWTVRAAADLGTNVPANATAMVLWMLGKPLQFNPATQYQYSDFGYTVLGRILERITGTNYEQHIQSVVAEAGIRRMRLSGSRRLEKLPGEVTSYDYPGASLTTSIFPEDIGPVPWPYNFSYTTMDSDGGWAASVIDLLRFASAVDGRAAYPILPKHEGGAMWFYSLPKHDQLCLLPEKIDAGYLGALKFGNIFSLDVGIDYAGCLRGIDVQTLRKVGQYIRGELKPPRPPVSPDKLAEASNSGKGSSGFAVATASDGNPSTRWGDPEVSAISDVEFFES